MPRAWTKGSHQRQRKIGFKGKINEESRVCLLVVVFPFFFFFFVVLLKDDCAWFWLRRCKHPERAVKKKRPNASLRRYFQMQTWKREQSKTIKREKAALLSESSITQVIQVVMEVPPSCRTLFPSAGSAAALSHLGQDKCEWLLSGLFQEAAGLTPTLASTARSVVAFATRPHPSPACPRLSQPMKALFSQNRENPD